MDEGRFHDKAADAPAENPRTGGSPVAGGALALLRMLPPVHRLLAWPEAQELAGAYGAASVLRAVRAALDDLRRAIGEGTVAFDRFPRETFFAVLGDRLAAENAPKLRPAINATGIVLHTNLGRAPLAEEAVAALSEAATGYANLEIDLDSGRRGSRYAAVAGLLQELTGAEAALVVNNNAAAVLLALSALAQGGEAVVSRGELVEIGGSFRIPDVVRQGGAKLVEVGTTNRTRLSDYEQAIGPDTRVLLKVHQSNYRIVGFTEAPPLADLAALARRHGLLLVEDLGSGTLVDLRAFELPYEPTVRDSVAAGVDLVTFSGDKLLGGPQAGIVVGRAEAVARLKSHPLLRALRIDKLSLAALEATLRLYLEPEHLAKRLPVLAMLGQSVDTLQRRARELADRLAGLAGLDIRLEESLAYAGGGALPGIGMPARAVSVAAAGLGVDELARRLRLNRPAVVGRIEGGRLLLDLRTVTDRDLPAVVDAFRSALA